VSKETLYRLVADGRFPVVKLRGRLVIAAVAIEQMATAAIGSNTLIDPADWVGQTLR